jgi:hypothetical protein
MLTLSHELPQNQLSCGYCSIFGMPLIYKHFTWTEKHMPPNSNCITYVLRLLSGLIQQKTSATMQKRYVTRGEIITIWQLPLEGGSVDSGYEWLDFNHRIRVLPEPIVFCRAKVNKLLNNLPLHEASSHSYSQSQIQAWKKQVTKGRCIEHTVCQARLSWIYQGQF